MQEIELPAGGSRFRSIAWPLIGVLVLVAGWTVGISYYFHHRSIEAEYAAEQQARGARAARVVESMLVTEYQAVEQGVQSLAQRVDLAAALEQRTREVPTMCAASAEDLWESKELITSENMLLLLIGSAVAFIVAAIAVKAFVAFLTRYGFKYFGYYRILLGILFLAYALYTGMKLTT